MKTWIRQNRGFLVFLLLFGIFRTAVADWNPIPSGSMRPTLVEGDVVLVDRLAYDLKLPLTDVALLHLGEPKRGDVVTFYSPVDRTHLIKRLVALPGDVVEMRDEALFVNGTPARYVPLGEVVESIQGHALQARRLDESLAGRQHAMQVIPAIAARRDFGPLTVPAGSYFFLGDNRDDSADSRYIGPVPRSLLIGRAHHVIVSADILGHWMPRWERTASAIR